MSVILKTNTSEWILDSQYELNRVHLLQTEKCHTHQFIEIVYTYQGRGRHRIDDREYPVGHGDLLLINYRSQHTVEPIENLEYVDIMLKPEYVNETLRGTENAFLLLKLHDFSEFDKNIMNENILLHFDGDDRKKLETLIEWTEEEQRTKTIGGELIQHSMLNLLLSMIFRKMAQSKADRFCVNEALLAYIDQNCSDPLRLDELAAKCFYTPEHFSRTFKKYTGLTLKEYIFERRIQKAKRLLERTDMPIERIISECGFSNRTAFFKKFSQIVGCTPLQYRKNQI